MKIEFSNESAADIKESVKRDLMLSEMRSPISPFYLWLFSGIYNSANVLLLRSEPEFKVYTMVVSLLIIAKELSAAFIAVFGLAKLYHMFAYNYLLKLVWYAFIVTAAFNFSQFVQLMNSIIEKWFSMV